MRVITREQLIAKRELLEDKSNTPCAYLDGKKYMIDELLENLQEIDTVSKLRPMSEAPMDGSSFLVCFNGSEVLNESYFDSIGNIWVGELYNKPKNFAGWIPMICYKPLEVDK